jgi:hypothetical protein
MKRFGLATTMVLLGGCSVELLEPAADPGDYALIDPEVVVLSRGLERMAIDHDDEENCLKPFGFHLGHGLFVDVDGNVSAIPQLLAPTGEGLAVAEPDLAVVGVGLFAQVMEREDDRYHIGRSERFGRYIEPIENGWALDEPLQRRPGLIVAFDGTQTVVMNAGWRLLVQSQGDHLLVQQTGIRDRTEIRHGDDGAWYELDRVGPASPITALTVDDRTVVSGPGHRATHSRELDDGHEALVRRGALGRTTTTLTDAGWVEGTVLRTTVEVDGGRAVTGG